MLKQGEADLRRYPRARVAWPVAVEVEGEAVQTETVNLSPFGVKLARSNLPLNPGTRAKPRFHPPEGESLDVQAILWRIDPEGGVFFTGLDWRLFPTNASPQDAQPRCPR